MVNAHIIVDKIDFAHRGHIRGDDLGIVGNHRAVVVVVAQLLVQVIAHAGVEDGFDALADEPIDMAVHQFGRETDGVRRNGRLPGDIQLAAGKWGNGHIKPEIGKQRVPEGQKLIQIQAEGQADCSAGSVFSPVVHQGGELFLLVGIQIQAAAALFSGDRTVTPVAADETPAGAEIVNRQPAVVFAQAAARLAHLMGEGVE